MNPLQQFYSISNNRRYKLTSRLTVFGNGVYGYLKRDGTKIFGSSKIKSQHYFLFLLVLRAI